MSTYRDGWWEALGSGLREAILSGALTVKQAEVLATVATLANGSGDPLRLRVPDLARALGVSRATAYRRLADALSTPWLDESAPSVRETRPGGRDGIPREVVLMTPAEWWSPAHRERLMRPDPSCLTEPAPYESEPAPYEWEPAPYAVAALQTLDGETQPLQTYVGMPVSQSPATESTAPAALAAWQARNTRTEEGQAASW